MMVGFDSHVAFPAVPGLSRDPTKDESRKFARFLKDSRARFRMNDWSPDSREYGVLTAVVATQRNLTSRSLQIDVMRPEAFEK